MVAKASDTQINQRKWGGVGRGGKGSRAVGFAEGGEEGCGHPSREGEWR